MGYHIGNLGLGNQSGDHKAKTIEKYPDAGLKTCNLSIALPFELIWIVFQMPNFSHFLPKIYLYYDVTR